MGGWYKPRWTKSRNTSGGTRLVVTFAPGFQQAGCLIADFGLARPLSDAFLYEDVRLVLVGRSGFVDPNIPQTCLADC